MKHFRIKIYTTSSTSFPMKEIPSIAETVNLSIRGAKIVQVTSAKYPRHKKPLLTSEKKIDWTWFAQTLTKEAVAEGFNVVVFHMRDQEKKAYGIRKNLNGAYRADEDDILEFYLTANVGEKAKHYRNWKNYSEFRRVFMHELLHGFFRKTGVDTEHVHFFDYKLRDVELGLKVVNFKDK